MDYFYTVLPFLHWCLLRLPAELAHRIGIRLLRLYQGALRFGFIKQRIPSAFVLPSLAQLKFGGRVGLAAGFDKNAEVFSVMEQFGFGFVEVGTVTPLPQEGNPKPRLWRLPGYALVNKMGFNNCGLIEFKKHLLEHKGLTHIPILANIGKNKETSAETAIDDYRKSLEFLVGAVDGFVVNVSSPNTPGLRDLQTLTFLEAVLRAAPAEVPLFFKFSPDLENAKLEELCAWASSERRVSGVVVTNTSKAFAEENEFPEGGLSGGPLFERSIECISLARQAIKDKVVIGAGGIISVDRALNALEQGADLVEVYTGFVYFGIRWVRELASRISSISRQV